MSLHDKINQIPIPGSDGKSTSRGSYIVGAIDMRNAAAQLANDADARIAALEAAAREVIETHAMASAASLYGDEDTYANASDAFALAFRRLSAALATQPKGETNE